MGIEDRTELVAVVVADQCALFEARGSEGRRTLMAVTCLPSELDRFHQVLGARPFGFHSIHRVWLRSLTQGNGLACRLRTSAGSSRQEVTLPLCEETYAGLNFVFNQFALDHELIPDVPPSVLDVTANPSFQRPAFGGR